MKKPFCDKCGKLCVNKSVHLGGRVEHFTNQFEGVGEDELRLKELCSDCAESILLLLDITPIPTYFDRMAVAAPPLREVP